MLVEKQKVLYDAPNVLNRADQPWVITVEGDAIVARWKWMDATFFAPTEISDEIRNYSFTVTLGNKGKYRELDATEKKSSNVSFNGGNLSFGTSTSGFKGKTTQKTVQFGVGKDKQTGKVGIIGFKFDNMLIKNQVRGYLEQCGWKKAGLFG